MINSSRNMTSGRRVSGFTLIEALVALLALSVGLLGVAGLQLTGLRANLSASWRSQATYLSYDILDRMRANRSNRVAYTIAVGEARVDPTVVVDADLIDWKNNLAITLPGGDGSVAVGGDDNTEITVTVQWDDSHGVDAPLVFTMRSRI